MQTPNRGTASAFIATVLDTHLHEVESESGYMSYIAQRPRAEKHGGHGLFSEADVTDLKAAKAELEAHNGKVWTFIFLCGGRTRNVLDTTKPPCGGIC